jgi:hypothetical protein
VPVRSRPPTVRRLARQTAGVRTETVKTQSDGGPGAVPSTGPMGRRPLAVALAVLVTLVVVQSSAAGPAALWPGVTFERGVQFTPSGPVAISVIRGPRPGGTTTLVPLLSNESLLGRESLTAMQRRLAPTATTAGVNGDFFALATGRPSGVLMREGQLISPPRTSRSSAGITSDGRLDVRRVGFFGSWVGAGPRRPLATVNDVPADGQSALFTDAYGPLTPLVPGAIAAVLFPFPLAQPGTGRRAPPERRADRDPARWRRARRAWAAGVGARCRGDPR